MSIRGDYRATYSVIVDSDEYKALSKDAKVLFWALKHSLGLSGIDVVFDDQLRDRSGLTQHELDVARQELIDDRWLEVEGRVHWLRNGLRFEPNVSVSHAKQRAGIERHLKGLPKASVVNRMATYYGITAPFPDRVPEGSTKSIDTLPQGSAKGPEAGEPLTLDVDVDVDGDGNGDERGSRARADSATPDVDGHSEPHPIDAFEPTDDHRASARELRVDLDALVARWRLHRKANGLYPADLGSDLSLWILREPDFTANGNGAHAEPPRTVPPPMYREPTDGPVVPPEEAKLILGELAKSLRSDPTPEPRRRREPLTREQQIAIAKGGKIEGSES